MVLYSLITYNNLEAGYEPFLPAYKMKKNMSKK
jgi:hypothetical protein